jgi:hypothetical protein
MFFFVKTYYYVHHTLRCGGHIGFTGILSFYGSLPRFVRRFWSNGPMDWLPSLLVMLIILKSRSERKEFSWLHFKDFNDFEAVFHKIFTESRYLSFTRSGAEAIIFAHALNALKHLDSRLLIVWNSLIYYVMNVAINFKNLQKYHILFRKICLFIKSSKHK